MKSQPKNFRYKILRKKLIKNLIKLRAKAGGVGLGSYKKIIFN